MRWYKVLFADTMVNKTLFFHFFFIINVTSVHDYLL